MAHTGAAVTTRYQDGGVASHSLPLRRRGDVPPQAVLGPVRAVVLRTYCPDTAGQRQGLGVECDVITTGVSPRVLPRVPVRGGGGAYHVDVWTPHPTTRNLRTGAAVTWTAVAIGDVLRTVDRLSDLDGDHVLVEFLGGNAADPLITAPLPHPRAAVRPRGASVAPISSEQPHPATPDAPCRYVRHAGTVAMVDRRGSVVVDTVGAPETGDGRAAGGAEPAANVIVQLASAARLEVRVGSAVLLVVEGGQVKLGANPAQHAVLFEALRSWLTSGLSVSTAFGPSGGAITQLPDTCRSPGVLIDAP